MRPPAARRCRPAAQALHGVGLSAVGVDEDVVDAPRPELRSVTVVVPLSPAGMSPVFSETLAVGPHALWSSSARVPDEMLVLPP